MKVFTVILLIGVLIKLNDGNQNQDVAIACEDQDIIFTGFNINFSDVIQKLEANTDCKDWRKLIIFATGTFTVDRNYDKMKTDLNLIILAPKWIVKDNPTISLYGKTQQSTTGPAKSGNDFVGALMGQNGLNGRNGNNGLSGLAGGCGGSIFAIGLEGQNMRSLTFKSEGGHGTNGQDGGNGGKGGSVEMQILDHHVEDSELPPCSVGGIGGSGGNGGNGGLGGLPGNVFFKIKGAQPEVSLNTGRLGSYGNGGRLGPNGETQSILEQKSGLFSSGGLLTRKVCEQQKSTGIDGKSGLNIPQIDKPKQCAVKNKASILNKFKAYAINQIANNLLPNLTQMYAFFKYLDEISNVEKFYSTSDYIHELTIVEEQLSYVQNKSYLFPIYESLKKRIEIEESIPESQNLKIEILNHINDIITKSDENLISLNVNNAYTELKNFEIKFSDNLKSIDKNAEFIKFKKNSYKEINKGIEHAENTLLPNIKTINEKIQYYIENNLMDEIVTHINNINGNNEELASLIPYAIASSSLKVFGQACSVVGAATTAAGGLGLPFTALGVGADIAAEAFYSDSDVEDVMSKRSKNFENIDAMMKSVKQLKDEKAEAFQKQMAILPKAVKDKIEYKLEALSDYSEKFDKLQEILDDNKDDLNTSTVHQLEAVAMFVGASSNIYKVVENTIKNVNQISTIISNQKESLSKVYELNNFVYKDLSPIVLKISNDVNLNAKSLNDKHQISLNIIEDNVQQKLDKLKDVFNSVAGLETKKLFSQILNELSETFKSLYKLYNSIAGEKKSTSIVEFFRTIDEIQNRNPESYESKDIGLFDATINYRTTILANKIINKYKTLFYNVRQYIFPFSAPDYNHQFTLNTDNKKLYSLANEALGKLSQLNKRYIDYERDVSNSFIVERKNTIFEDTIAPPAVEQFLQNRTKILTITGMDNAAKLDDIDVQISLHLPKKKVIRLTQYFTFTLTHTGNSVYKCGNDNYAILNVPKTFQSHKIGNWTTQELSPYFLSPYGQWKLELFPKAGKDIAKLYDYTVKIKILAITKHLKDLPPIIAICNSLPDYKEFLA